jgi:hypothetical protein
MQPTGAGPTCADALHQVDDISRQQVGYSTVRRDARNLGGPVGT